MRKMRPVRSVDRALKVLESINQRPQSVSETSAATGLPRTTVHRLLFTLCDSGYLNSEFRNGVNTFFIKDDVKRLSSGAHSYLQDYVRIRPLVDAFCKDVKWPVYLTVNDGFELDVIYGTESLSPFFLKDSILGTRLPLFQSASGLAFLAASDQHSREALMHEIKHFLNDERQIKWLKDSLEEAQSKGWASMEYCDWRSEDRPISSFAVGLRDGQRCIGTITIRYHARAMSAEDAAAEFGERSIAFSQKCCEKLALN